MPSPFVKGNKLGKGRPKGMVNKATRNYLDFQFWFRKISEDLELITEPEKRIQIECQIVDKMLAKVQNLPGTPAESVKNAEQAAAVLKDLEKATEQKLVP